MILAELITIGNLCVWIHAGCQLDGVTEVMEELDKVSTSGTLGKPGSLLQTDTLWALQSPTSAADWLSRLQKKDKEKKELEKYGILACT